MGEKEINSAGETNPVLKTTLGEVIILVAVCALGLTSIVLSILEKDVTTGVLSTMLLILYIICFFLIKHYIYYRQTADFERKQCCTMIDGYMELMKCATNHAEDIEKDSLTKLQEINGLAKKLLKNLGNENVEKD